MQQHEKGCGAVGRHNDSNVSVDRLCVRLNVRIVSPHGRISTHVTHLAGKERMVTCCFFRIEHGGPD